MSADGYFVASALAAHRPPPAQELPRLAALRRAFFATWVSGVMTVVIAFGVLAAAFLFIRWGVVDAVFASGKDANAACRAAEGSGACWPVVTEKARLILFGLYPYAEQWRPALACAIAIALYVVSCFRACWRPWLALVWLGAGAVAGVLMWGGMLGLPFVPDDQWGGLPVTLALATLGLALGFPVAIALALARRSTAFPAMRAFAVAYIELARGVPLLTVLFMASVMVPLFLPEGMTVSKLLRVQVAIALFAAAYLAEVIRGGLQAIPRGQHEAADALGLSYGRKTVLIVLPQALRLSIPGIVNTFISFFKATSIVIVVGIFDLMTAAKRSVADPQWQGFGTEVYLFVGLIYFVFCFSMSRYSRWLERRLHVPSR